MRSPLLVIAVLSALALAGCGDDASSDANHVTHLSPSSDGKPSRPRPALPDGQCPTVFNWTPRASGGITVSTDLSGHQTVGVGLVDGRLVTGAATPGPMDVPYSIEMPQVPVAKVKRVLLQADDGSHCLVSRG